MLALFLNALAGGTPGRTTSCGRKESVPKNSERLIKGEAEGIVEGFVAGTGNGMALGKSEGISMASLASGGEIAGKGEGKIEGKTVSAGAGSACTEGGCEDSQATAPWPLAPCSVEPQPLTRHM